MPIAIAYAPHFPDFGTMRFGFFVLALVARSVLAAAKVASGGSSHQYVGVVGPNPVPLLRSGHSKQIIA